LKFDLRDLELFVAVADCGSIARAAELAHTVASAISKRLSDMEDMLGTPLITRGTRGIALTPAGHTLLTRARLLLAQATQLEDEIASYALGARGHVRLFANISAIVEFLPAALASFVQRYPDIRLHLEEHVSDVIARAVAENVADLGIVSDTPAIEGLQQWPFRRDELVVVTRPDHPIAQRDRDRARDRNRDRERDREREREGVTFAECLESPFVGLHATSALHRQLVRAASEAGRPFEPRIQVTSFDAVCSMVAAGLGIGIVPRTATTAYTTSLGLTAVPLADPWAQRELSLCARSLDSLSPAARLLRDHLLQPPPL
jgi:DNA-binding transcriptional LysR family regulator